MAGSNSIFVVGAMLAIDGRTFHGGDVVGEMRDGTPAPTVPGVTRGHLEPRLRDGRLAVGEPPAKATEQDPAEPVGLQPPYKGHKQAELLAEVNRRRTAGRNVETVSQKVADLIAALEADDDQLELQAEANQGERDHAGE